MSRSRSRSPHLDEELLKVREELKRHVTAFNEKEGLNFDSLIARYRKHSGTWAASGETAQILKHAVHVAAWIVFGTRTFGRDRENVLQDLALLLCEMLQERAGVQPTPRLVNALRYVEELLLDFDGEDDDSWANSCLREVQKAIFQHDQAVLRSHLGTRRERSPGSQKRTIAKPGTHGRTDQALVRRVLGGRFVNLPPRTMIRWDGRQQRWYAANATGNIRGSNALRKRFASDEDAIRFVADVLDI